MVGLRGRRYAFMAGTLVLVVSGWWLTRPPTGVLPPPDDSPLDQSALDQSASGEPVVAGIVTVHVSGLVAEPGLVVVAESARVADVIAAAGGFLPGAEPAALNLAAPITDGQQVHVPEQGGQIRVGQDQHESPVSLNRATVQQLTDLPGVGPVLAARIVEQRDASGPFESVEDLLSVAGIGEAKLAALRDRVAVP